MKTNLLGYNRQQLETFFTDMGEKRFRAQQVMQWIHQVGVEDFDQMTNLSKALRDKLKTVATIQPPDIVHKEYSKDGTRKWVISSESGGKIETVLIPDGDRKTLCISSQVGCSVDCSFCSTGKQGFEADLSTADIIGQLWIANRSFGPQENKGAHPITNVVMMGMGEPLLNYDAVLPALEIMKDDFAYGISKRKVTVSTSGVVPAIDKLGEAIDVSLAVSLHAPNDELRNTLVPLNKKYPLVELLASCRRFLQRFNSQRRTITMEYVLLEGVNDNMEHAEQLAELLKDVPSKINLIPFNPFPGAPYKRPSNNRVHRFQKYLSDAGYIVTTRTTRGDDIDAACGQLVGQVQDKTRRSERWKAIQVQQDDSPKAKEIRG